MQVFGFVLAFGGLGVVALSIVTFLIGSHFIEPLNKKIADSFSPRFISQDNLAIWNPHYLMLESGTFLAVIAGLVIHVIGLALTGYFSSGR